MKKKIKYYVIGGQYFYYNYGGTETLHAAKCLATKKMEYWDNWQGWHKPRIYKAEDCELGNSFYGENYYPKPYAVPEASWNEYIGKWEKHCCKLVIAQKRVNALLKMEKK